MHKLVVRYADSRELSDEMHPAAMQCTGTLGTGTSRDVLLCDSFGHACLLLRLCNTGRVAYEHKAELSHFQQTVEMLFARSGRLFQ